MQAGKKYHLVLHCLCNKKAGTQSFCNSTNFFSDKAVAVKPGCVYFAVTKVYFKWNTGTSVNQI